MILSSQELRIIILIGIFIIMVDHKESSGFKQSNEKSRDADYPIEKVYLSSPELENTIFPVSGYSHVSALKKDPSQTIKNPGSPVKRDPSFPHLAPTHFQDLQFLES